MRVNFDEMDKTMNATDKNGDDKVSFEEYLELVELQKNQKGDAAKKLEEMKAKFKSFDKSGDGQISAEELEEGLSKLGYNPSGIVLRGMLRRADKNRDGQINYNEFAQMMCRMNF